jgi:hypothetical protein
MEQFGHHKYRTEQGRIGWGELARKKRSARKQTINLTGEIKK